MAIIRAWKGTDDRKSLSEAARAVLPANPGGALSFERGRSGLLWGVKGRIPAM